MPSGSKFSLAVHILVALSYSQGEWVSSQALADSAATNPVVIRRLLALLQKAGLVSSQTGAGGGSRLERAPGEISLLDVYRAVDESGIFRMHEPNPDCPIGGKLPEILSEDLTYAEEAMQEYLDEVSLAELSAEVLPGYRRELAH